MTAAGNDCHRGPGRIGTRPALTRVRVFSGVGGPEGAYCPIAAVALPLELRSTASRPRRRETAQTINYPAYPTVFCPVCGGGYVTWGALDRRGVWAKRQETMGPPSALAPARRWVAFWPRLGACRPRLGACWPHRIASLPFSPAGFGRRLDHGHDARPERLGQRGPCVDEGLQVGVDGGGIGRKCAGFCAA